MLETNLLNLENELNYDRHTFDESMFIKISKDLNQSKGADSDERTRTRSESLGWRHRFRCLEEKAQSLGRDN